MISNEKDKESKIILFPDYKDLKDEIERLKIELSVLLLEQDELQFVICKNIETEYILKLGGLEYKVYEAQCTVLRYKRKIELIQMKKNRQEKINIQNIEAILDEEFREYEIKLQEHIDKMNDALNRDKAKVLTEEENKELKKMYRTIVKKLHPDINPDVSESQKRLLDNAMEAYKSGDLKALRIIYEMIDDCIIEEDIDVMGKIIKKRDELKYHIKSIQDKIKRIKSEYPYNVKDIISDDKKVAQKKKGLEEILIQYRDVIKMYKLKIEEMLR